MRVRNWLGALALLAIMLPDAGVAQVSAKYGLGNIYEPLCTHPAIDLTLGDPRYTLAPNACAPFSFGIPGDPGCQLTGENAGANPLCTTRINRLHSSGQVIQTDPSYPVFNLGGTVTLVEDPPGTVNLAAGSGTAAFTVLLLNLPFIPDQLAIISSGTTLYTGGNGTIYGSSLDGTPSPAGNAPPLNSAPLDPGAVNDQYPSPLTDGLSVVVWSEDVVQQRAGCLSCSDGGGGCAIVGLSPSGTTICGAQIQPDDPGVRTMPDLISNSDWDTWNFPEDGDSHYDAEGFVGTSTEFRFGEALTNSANDIVPDRTSKAGSAVWLSAFRDRECATVNPGPTRFDPLFPFAGRPDPDCDGVAEWRFGLGSLDTAPGVPGVPCDDLNANNNCEIQVAAPADAVDPGDCDAGAIFTPENLCVAPGPEDLTSTALMIQSTDEHEVFPIPGTIDVVETPGTPGTCSVSGLACFDDANCAGDCGQGLAGEACLDDFHCTAIGSIGEPGSTLCDTDPGACICDFNPGETCVGEVQTTLAIPAGSNSGHVNKSLLNLDITTIGTVIIQSSTGALFDGATGVGSPAVVADWDNPVPYNLYGCLICTEVTPTACDQIGLGPSGSNICGNSGIQPAPPAIRPRHMPDWLGVTGNVEQTAEKDAQRLASQWLLPLTPTDVLGNPLPEAKAFYEHGQLDGTGESVNSDVSDSTTAQNGGAWVYFGFRDRECGMTTPDPCDTNGDGVCDPAVDLPPITVVTDPPHGKPDRDCDRIADENDLCPDWPGATVDSNGDGRGDACLCGDQNGDGDLNVGDLLGINFAIFNPLFVTPLCDANNDGRCNISDILIVNQRIFDAAVTTCYRHPNP